MRIYIPATLHEVRQENFGAGGRVIHALTAALRDHFERVEKQSYDDESLEYAAFIAAADTAIDLLAHSESEPLQRVVIAADVPEDFVSSVNQAEDHTLTGAELPSALELRQPVTLTEIVSFHVDEDTAHAANVLREAIGGGEEDREKADALDLLWFDVSELSELK